MEHRISFNTIITQHQAKAPARDGLCGDQSHIESCPIDVCLAEKLLVLYKDDASYAIIHAGIAKSAIPKLKRDALLVQSPCDGSRTRLRDCIADERKAEDSKKRVQDMLKMTKALREQLSATSPAISLPQVNTAAADRPGKAMPAPVSGATAKITDTVPIGNGAPPPSSKTMATRPSASSAHGSAITGLKASDPKAPEVPHRLRAHKTINTVKPANVGKETVSTATSADKKKPAAKRLDDDDEWELVQAPDKEVVHSTEEEEETWVHVNIVVKM